MKLRYLGMGTVHVEGAGEVSEGQELEVPQVTAEALLEQRPQHWEAATPAPPVEATHEEPRARRGR
jgi:hypothetical protein